MKKILSISFVLLTITGVYHFSSSDKIEIIGTWSITDYHDSSKFEDTWEFTSDNIFNELKAKFDGDSTLVPDENGTWILEGQKLTIIVIAEDVNGKQKLYKKPQIMTFEIIKEDEDYILEIIADGGMSDGKTTKLRLSKK